MNYYEHHLGDYAKDAAHLSLIEDGAYRRLLDAYYIREQPLPGDVKTCCKLARAATKPERDAVRYVLGEFFTLREDGYHQNRADAEISRFHVKSEKAKRSAEARWANRDTHSGGNANASANAMRTHSEGNAPRARPQAPSTNQKLAIGNSSASADTSQGETLEARACRLMREAGCPRVNPMHADLVSAIAEWVSPETLAATAKEAIEKGKGNPFEWAIATARGRAADGGNDGTRRAGGSESLCERAERLCREGDERERIAAAG